MSVPMPTTTNSLPFQVNQLILTGKGYPTGCGHICFVLLFNTVTRQRAEAEVKHSY